MYFDYLKALYDYYSTGYVCSRASSCAQRLLLLLKDRQPFSPFQPFFVALNARFEVMSVEGNWVFNHLVFFLFSLFRFEHI